MLHRPPAGHPRWADLQRNPKECPALMRCGAVHLALPWERQAAPPHWCYSNKTGTSLASAESGQHKGGAVLGQGREWAGEGGSGRAVGRPAGMPHWEGDRPRMQP